VCSKSEHHGMILEAREQANCTNIQVSQLQFRNRANSQRVNAQLIFKG